VKFPGTQTLMVRTPSENLAENGRTPGQVDGNSDWVTFPHFTVEFSLVACSLEPPVVVPLSRLEIKKGSSR
jgi:hypothetical protein